METELEQEQILRDRITVCNLVESDPLISPIPSSPLPDRVSLAATAHSQDQSYLYRLPWEVREAIYDDLLKSAGLTQHVFFQDGHYSHARCIVDHDATDVMHSELDRIYSAKAGVNIPAKFEWHGPPHIRGDLRRSLLDSPVWARRLASDWCNHWRCEEAILSASGAEGAELLENCGSPQSHSEVLSEVKTRDPFLPLLLLCKRSYLDWRALMYGSIRFTFTSIATASHFLSQSPLVVADIRFINISGKIHEQPTLGDVRPRNEPWDSLVTSLESLPHLNRVTCFLDTTRISARIQLGQNWNLFDCIEQGPLRSRITISIPLWPCDIWWVRDVTDESPNSPQEEVKQRSRRDPCPWLRELPWLRPRGWPKYVPTMADVWEGVTPWNGIDGLSYTGLRFPTDRGFVWYNPWLEERDWESMYESQLVEADPPSPMDPTEIAEWEAWIVNGMN